MPANSVLVEASSASGNQFMLGTDAVRQAHRDRGPSRRDRFPWQTRYSEDAFAVDFYRSMVASLGAHPQQVALAATVYKALCVRVSGPGRCFIRTHARTHARTRARTHARARAPPPFRIVLVRPQCETG